MVRVLFAIWLLFIVGLSLAPWPIKLHLTIGPFHNMGHFLVFFMATILGCWGVSGMQARLMRCLGLVVLAMALEGVEKMMTLRNPYEWSDVGFDCIGILVALTLLLLLPFRAAVVAKKSV